MKIMKTSAILLFVLAVALAACGGGGPSMSELEAVQTIAAGTAVAGITQTAAARPPTETPEPPTATPEPPTETPEPSPTPETEEGEEAGESSGEAAVSPTPGLQPVLGAPPTSTPGGPAGSCTYAAAFEGVENTPDGTAYEFGKEFTKTWRVKNTGTCTWTESVNLIWVYSETDGKESSELMGAQGVIAVVTDPVQPNGYLDIAVRFRTPSTLGVYKVFFKFRSSTAIFGVNGNGNLWVEIKACDSSGLCPPSP